MKYAFSVLVKKDQEDALAKAVIIKEFKMRLTVSERHQQRIEVLGFQLFLEELLLAILRKKDQNKEDFASERFLDTLLDSYLESDLIDKGALPELEAHDLLLKMEVVFQSARKFRFFATFLPPLLRITILAEIVTSTVVNIGTFQLTENFLPMNGSSGQVLAVTQTVLSALFNLFLAFSAPGMAFMGDFGAVIDDGLQKAVAKCRGRVPVVQGASAVTEGLPRLVSFKIRSCQGLFCLLALNSFITNILQDYQQMASLRNAILATNEDAFVPAWATIIASWVSFGFGQLNDPIQLLSLVMMGFALIRGYFSLKQAGKGGERYVESDTSEWLEADDVLAIGVECKSPVAAIVHGLGQFSSNRSTEHALLHEALLSDQEQLS